MKKLAVTILLVIVALGSTGCVVVEEYGRSHRRRSRTIVVVDAPPRPHRPVPHYPPLPPRPPRPHH